MFDLEERESNELNLICLISQATWLLRCWRSSRRPRSPSSNHNVKEPNLARIFILPEKHYRSQDRVSPAAWAAYIGAW